MARFFTNMRMNMNTKHEGSFFESIGINMAANPGGAQAVVHLLREI